MLSTDSFLPDFALVIILCNLQIQLHHENLNNQLNFLAKRAWSPGLLKSSGAVETSDKVACSSMNNIPVL